MNASLPPTGQAAVLRARVTPRRAYTPSRTPAWHRAAEIGIRVVALTSIAAVLLIVAFVAKEALPLFFSGEIHKEVTLTKMWTAQAWPGYDAPEHIWQPVSEIPKYGIWPLVLGTLKVSLVAMLIAVPLGVGAALYLSQYAGRRTREIVKPAIELLAGIPSVVLGFFALMVMASWFQDWLGLESRLNALVAGAALSFAIIPVIFTISEEALGAVPRSYIEASTALGAARYQTVLRVLIPAASPGIAAAVALGLGRAVGETMIVLMATGNTAVMNMNPFKGFRALSANVAVEIQEAPEGGTLFRVLFLAAFLLFLMTFVVNTAAELVRIRLRRKFQSL